MDGMNNLFGSLKTVRTQLQGSEKKENFDDLKGADGKENVKQVTGICIRSGYIMDAIGIIDENGKKYLHGNPNGGKETVISLKDDTIRTIRGDIGISYKGNAISNLTVEMTSGKKYGPFGTGKSGKIFCLTFPENAAFAGFVGNADKNIVKSLGLIYCEGGENVLQSMLGDKAGFEL